LEAEAWRLECDDVIRDVDDFKEIELEANGETFIARNAVQGCCGKVFQALAVALPATIREKAGRLESASHTLVSGMFKA